ncbi:MAG: response regulator transcription factor, partial [Candidatus Obscuribacterales bacterium]|nr:response regulator transcription factor [Candidatus Obscuribacterales bacterium]
MEETQKLRLVIIDDHNIVRVGLKLLLETWPEIELVGEGSNGIEALKLVEQLDPDIVLMDVAMPEIDGIEAARRIRCFNQKVRIIMLTSHTDVTAIQASLAAGVNGYCLKDVEDDRLKRAILSVIDGDVWLDARATKDVLSMAIGQKLAPPDALSKTGVSEKTHNYVDNNE